MAILGQYWGANFGADFSEYPRPGSEGPGIGQMQHDNGRIGTGTASISTDRRRPWRSAAHGDSVGCDMSTPPRQVGPAGLAPVTASSAVTDRSLAVACPGTRQTVRSSPAPSFTSVPRLSVVACDDDGRTRRRHQDSRTMCRGDETVSVGASELRGRSRRWGQYGTATVLALACAAGSKRSSC